MIREYSEVSENLYEVLLLQKTPPSQNKNPTKKNPPPKSKQTMPPPRFLELSGEVQMNVYGTF